MSLNRGFTGEGEASVFKDNVVLLIVLWSLQMHSGNEDVFSLEVSKGGNWN